MSYLRMKMIMGIACILTPFLCRAELPDPTRPADFFNAEPIDIQDLPQKLIDFRLTAIRISGDDRSAIINGQLMRIGEKFGTAELVAIDSTSVIIDHDNRHVILPLYSQQITKIPRD